MREGCGRWRKPATGMITKIAGARPDKKICYTVWYVLCYLSAYTLEAQTKSHPFSVN